MQDLLKLDGVLVSWAMSGGRFFNESRSMFHVKHYACAPSGLAQNITLLSSWRRFSAKPWHTSAA